MGTKHDILTEEELKNFSFSKRVGNAIQQFSEGFTPPLPPDKTNILDWGCGRGRSVARLLENKYNAFGVEIDENVIKKGIPLFESRGLAPHKILFQNSQLNQFRDNFFHIIFSEQVLEHVKEIESTIKELFRLTAPGGIGVHEFPGKFRVKESHVMMPLVHWLPKNRLRKMAVALFLKMGKGPQKPWSEAGGQNSGAAAVDTYTSYLNEKTFYREIRCLCRLFSDNGFDVKYALSTMCQKKYVPHLLSRNGFPHGNIILYTTKS